jgi:hypothetical protein
MHASHAVHDALRAHLRRGVLHAGFECRGGISVARNVRNLKLLLQLRMVRGSPGELLLCGHNGPRAVRQPAACVCERSRVYGLPVRASRLKPHPH